MSIQQLNPVLHFNGNAAKAIELYERALGARVEHMMRFSDHPAMNVPEEQKNGVMHARLSVGGGIVMVSDTMPGHPVPTGGSVFICLHFSDVAELNQKFDALAAGGKVTLPVHAAFWGATFGMLTDAFGISWCFHCENKG